MAERYGKLFEDVDKRWQERLQSDAEQPRHCPKREQEALRQVFYGKDSPGNLPAELIRSLYNVPALMQMGPLRAELMRLDATHPGAPQRAMALVDSPQPKNSRVFIRGNPNRLGEEAPRQFLAILAGDKRQPFTRGSGRLELARAIASRGESPHGPGDGEPRLAPSFRRRSGDDSRRFWVALRSAEPSRIAGLPRLAVHARRLVAQETAPRVDAFERLPTKER